MSHLRLAPLLPLALLGPIVLLAFAPAARAETPTCLHWRAQTVANGPGYNHVVILDNTCDKPASCSISTDVAPEPIQASVPAQQKVELTTFRGSPASVFKARVECSLR